MSNSKAVKEADLHDAPFFTGLGQLPKKIYKNANSKLAEATMTLTDGVLVVKTPGHEVGIPMTNVKGLLFEPEAEAKAPVKK